MVENNSFTVLHYAKTLLTSKRQKTLHDLEVAIVFREPGVTSGYRPTNRGWSYYMNSVVHLNNETINIWSHLVGCLLMIYQMYTYAHLHDVWIDETRRVVHVFNLCCVIYTMLSAVAHALHSCSDLVHYTCFQADYAGIGFYVFGTALQAFYISCENQLFYETLQPIFLPLNVLLAWFSCFCCSYAKLRYKRPYPFARKLWQLGSVGLHLTLCCSGAMVRYVNFQSEERLTHHTNCLIWFLFSIFFFSSHYPEKIWPGHFNIVGQGHQIFHVMIIVTSYLQTSAAEIDVTKVKVGFHRSFPSWQELIISLLFLSILDGLTIVCFNRYTKNRIEQDKKSRK